MTKFASKIITRIEITIRATFELLIGTTLSTKSLLNYPYFIFESDSNYVENIWNEHDKKPSERNRQMLFMIFMPTAIWASYKIEKPGLYLLITIAGFGGGSH